MSDLEQQKIYFDCPNCGFPNYFTLAQLAESMPTICPGCKTTLKPDNQAESAKIRALLDGFAEFEGKLPKEIRIKI
ncbi:MAG: hypothetical protein ACLQT6_12785 [Desulfomonilaceae bacterium]